MEDFKMKKLMIFISAWGCLIMSSTAKNDFMFWLMISLATYQLFLYLKNV